MSGKVNHAIFIFSFAALVHAQHIQFGQPVNGIPIANPAVDRSGNLLLLTRNIAFGLGPGGSHPVAAPILAAHASQLNVVVPQQLEGNVWMEIERNGERIFLRHLRWSSNSPEPLLQITSEGATIPSLASPYVLLADTVNEDGTPNSADNPALPGSIVTVYVAGLGMLDANLPDNGYGDGIARPVQDYVVKTEFGRIELIEARTVPGRTVAVAAVRFRVPQTPSGVFHFSVEPSYSNANFSPRNFLYIATQQ